MPAPWLLAVGLVVALLVLIPARRLHLAEVSGRWIGWYAFALWLLAMTIVVRPTFTRVLVPFLLVAYLAPFVASPERVGRVLRRGRLAGDPAASARPMKDVTPPDGRTAGDGTPPADDAAPDDGDPSS